MLHPGLAGLARPGTGDVGSSGAREVVPDFLILCSSPFVAGRGVLGLVRKPAQA